MDYNFKRIADVEEIESVSEDTMFLVNDGGVIKQTHAQMQSDGDGSSLNPILSNAKSTGGIGWTESGEQTVITWNGDDRGRAITTRRNMPDSSIVYVKVADVLDNFDPENIVEIYTTIDDEGASFGIEDDSSHGLAAYRDYRTDGFDIVYVYDYTKAVDCFDYYCGYTFPENGIYFCRETYGANQNYTFEVKCNKVCLLSQIFHEIKEQYLPVQEPKKIVLEFLEDDGEIYCESGYRPSDVVSALSDNKNVVGFLRRESQPDSRIDLGQAILICYNYGDDQYSLGVGFMPCYNGTNKYMVRSQGDGTYFVSDVFEGGGVPT